MQWIKIEKLSSVMDLYLPPMSVQAKISFFAELLKVQTLSHKTSLLDL